MWIIINKNLENFLKEHKLIDIFQPLVMKQNKRKRKQI